MSEWPTVELDPLTQLRVMHAELPGSWLEERVFDVPFDRFWQQVDDLATFVPTIDPLVSRLEVLEREGDDIVVKTNAGRLDGELREGFCWMQSRRGRWFFVGMAARPLADGRTLYGHMEGMRLPGARALRPWFRRTVRWDLRGIERLTRSL